MRTASPRGQKVGPRARVVTRERLPYLGTRGAKTAYYDRIRDGMGPSEAERSRASQGSVFQTHHLSSPRPSVCFWGPPTTPWDLIGVYSTIQSSLLLLPLYEQP